MKEKTILEGLAPQITESVFLRGQPLKLKKLSKIQELQTFNKSLIFRY
jgi:hypothetical protein